MMRVWTLLSGVFIGLAPGAAAETFVAPEGCRHLATVQQENCGVWQVLACGPRPQDRRIYDFENGVLQGVGHYHGGLVEYDYDERAGQQFMDILYDKAMHGPAIDAFDPLNMRQSVEFTADYLLDDEGELLRGAFKMNFDGAIESKLLKGRRVLAWSTRRRFVDPKGAVNTVDIYYYDVALAAAIGFTARFDTGESNSKPLKLFSPGQDGFGDTRSLCDDDVAGLTPPWRRS